MNQCYRTTNIYNMNKIKLDLDNDIPIIKNNNYIPKDLIGFNYAKEKYSKCVGLHFYLDDYQFERVWNKPERYIEIFKKYGCILSPDFSLYTDMPEPMQIWNIYRSRFLGQYYQKQGIKVIPTISWANENTYKFCFRGIPKGSVVSISTVGVIKSKEAKELWKKGVAEMIKQIKPSKILIYGNKIEYNFEGIEIIYYKNHITEKFDKMEKSKQI